VTTEWRNHTIVLQTVEVEAESRPLGDHKGGEAENDPAAQVREGCCIETITRPLGNHKGGEDDPVMILSRECPKLNATTTKSIHQSLASRGRKKI